MRAANDVLRFVLELCALAALATRGLSLHAALVVRVLAAVVAVAVAAVLWGLFLAPRRRVNRGQLLPAVVVEAVVFLAATLGLLLAGHRLLVLVFVVVALVNSVTTRRWPSALAGHSRTSA